MLPRSYYPADLVNSLSTYLYFIQAAFVVAWIWILRHGEFGPSRVLVLAFVVAHALATFLLGWAGASLNHLTEAMVATAMMAALAIPAAERIVRGSPFPDRKSTRLNSTQHCSLPSGLARRKPEPSHGGHGGNRHDGRSGDTRGGANCPRLAVSTRRLHPAADAAVLSDEIGRAHV